MRLTNRLLVGISLVVLVVMISMTMLAQAPAQPGQGGGGRGAQATPPQNPTAVQLPAVTGPITGPGQPYESVQSLAPGKGLANFKYEAKEYFISGTANGQPYKTRIVVRKPASNSKFSGMVLVEPMHPSGSAHMFEMTSIYTMTSGHAAVDISAGGLCLRLERQLAVHTLLAVEPLHDCGAKTLLIRVAWAVQDNQNGWLHGCVLSHRLSAEELELWLREQTAESCHDCC